MAGGVAVMADYLDQLLKQAYPDYYANALDTAGNVDWAKLATNATSSASSGSSGFNWGDFLSGLGNTAEQATGNFILPLTAYQSQQGNIDTLTGAAQTAGDVRQQSWDQYLQALSQPTSAYLQQNPTMGQMANEYAAGPAPFTPVQVPQGLTDVANSLTPENFQRILGDITAPGIQRGRERMARYGLENTNIPFEQMYVSQTGAALFPQLQQNVIGASQAIGAIENYNNLTQTQRVQLHQDLGNMLNQQLTQLREQDLAAATSVLNQALNTESDLYQALAGMDAPAMSAALAFLLGRQITAPTETGTNINIQTGDVNAQGGAGGTGGAGGAGGTGQGGAGGVVHDIGSSLGQYGQGALALLGNYVGQIPGLDAVVEGIATGNYGAIGDLPQTAINGIKSLGATLAGALGFGETALVNSSGELTQAGAATVNALMSNGVGVSDALAAVSTAGNLAGSVALTDSAGYLTESGAGLVNSLMSQGWGVNEALGAVTGANVPASGLVGPPSPINAGPQVPAGGTTGGTGATGTGGATGTTAASSQIANWAAGAIGGTFGTWAASQFTKHVALQEEGQYVQAGGAAGGAALGASIGSPGGPPGVAVGALIGAAVGWFAGTGVGRAIFGTGLSHGLSDGTERMIDRASDLIPSLPSDHNAFRTLMSDSLDWSASKHSKIENKTVSQFVIGLAALNTDNPVETMQQAFGKDADGASALLVYLAGHPDDFEALMKVEGSYKDYFNENGGYGSNKQHIFWKATQAGESSGFIDNPDYDKQWAMAELLRQMFNPGTEGSL
jgi:hypothetical protein